MAPHQLFPYDEWGGLRTTRQFLKSDGSVTQNDLCTVAERTVLAGGAPKSTFGDQSKVAGADDCEALFFSDLDDAVDDDDDDGGVGPESNWPRREFVPKRGVEIFVGGLTRSTRRDMLRDWFQHAGEVTEVRIARDKRRRRCRGYGYVRFATSDQANRAIESMHRFEFKHGRFLGVLPSDENRTLFVGGLCEEWSCQYITTLLKERMPGLRKVEPIPDREDRLKIRTFCFLEFDTHKEAAAIFNRHQVNPPPAQQQQPGYPTRNSLGQEKSPPSDIVKYTLKEHAFLGFERETRINSSGTASISGSSGDICGNGRGGGCSAVSVPESAECSGTRLASTPELVPWDATDVRRAQGSVLTADANSMPRDSHRTFGSDWWLRSMKDLGGGDDSGSGGDENASGSATTPKPNVDGETFAAWEDPVEGKSDNGGKNNGQPLVVDGAVLKVDWADPLRYHIHLNGGIKGPPASPEIGMPDGRSTTRVGVGSSSARGGVPSVVSRRASYGQGPWQISPLLPAGPPQRGRLEGNHTLAHRTEYQQYPPHQKLPHQTQFIEHHHAPHPYPNHRSDFLSGGRHRSPSPHHLGSAYRGPSTTTSQPVSTTGDRGYAVSDPTVSGAPRVPPFYVDGASIALLHGQQQQDIVSRTRTAHRGFPPCQPHLDEQENGVRLRRQPDAAVARRLQVPAHDQFQVRGVAYSDRPRLPSPLCDGYHHDRDQARRPLFREVDSASVIVGETGGAGEVARPRGHRDVAPLGGPTYSAAPGSPVERHQSYFQGFPSSTGRGAICSPIKTLSRSLPYQRPSAHEISRRGSLPSPSPWDRQVMEDIANSGNQMMTIQSNRLDSGEQPEAFENRERGDSRALEAYLDHLGAPRSDVEGRRRHAGVHGVQQQQLQRKQKHQLYQRERWEQGWTSGMGDHHCRQGITQDRESAANNGVPRPGGGGHFRLLMSDHGSNHQGSNGTSYQQRECHPSVQPHRGGIPGGVRGGERTDRSYMGERPSSGGRDKPPPGFSTSAVGYPMEGYLTTPYHAEAAGRWSAGRGGSNNGDWQLGSGCGTPVVRRSSSGGSGSSCGSGSGSPLEAETSPEQARGPPKSLGRGRGPMEEGLGAGLWEAIGAVEQGLDGVTQPSPWPWSSSRGVEDSDAWAP